MTDVADTVSEINVPFRLNRRPDSRPLTVDEGVSTRKEYVAVSYFYAKPPETLHREYSPVVRRWLLAALLFGAVAVFLALLGKSLLLPYSEIAAALLFIASAISAVLWLERAQFERGESD